MLDSGLILLNASFATLVLRPLSIFIECPFARIAWYLSPWPIRFNVISPLSISEWIKLILNPADLLGCPKEEERHLTLFVAICCDMIWMKRNEATRKPEKVEPAKLAAQIKLNYTNHFQAQTRFSSLVGTLHLHHR